MKNGKHITCESESSKSIRNIIYKTFPKNQKPTEKPSISVIGIDTEAFQDGHPYMLCTSLGDYFPPVEFPDCFFGRKYRNKIFVVWNLKYDSGALLRNLTFEELDQLRSTGKVEVNGYEYEAMAYKKLRIRKIQTKHRTKSGITIFDISSFYHMSLNNAAKLYLNDKKDDIDIGKITYENVDKHFLEIKKYCIQDCILTQKLAQLQIDSFEKMGIKTHSLISTAYISFQHFRKTCNPPTMHYFWNYHKKALDLAMRSYAGGKFEVTEKGTGNFYSYDIVSAYPAEIRNLYNLDHCKVRYSKEYIKEADYAFYDCDIKIPPEIHNTSPYKIQGVNIYPSGTIHKVITQPEYEYFKNTGCDIKIKDGVNIFTSDKSYVFRAEIDRLMRYKHKYKKENNLAMYNTTKVLLNSLYGKFVQLIWDGKKWKAGDSWNPFFASYITAKCRIKVTELQNKYKGIIAVHTDSVISKSKIDINLSSKIGGWELEKQGRGVIIGSGVYQIGKVVKIRGFPAKVDLLEILDTPKSHISFDSLKFHSWRDVIAKNQNIDRINRVEYLQRDLSVDFDKKRIWFDDYTKFNEILKRNVYSSPFIYF